MKCPHCSFENRSAAPFCENCGEVFPVRMNIPEIKTPSTDAKRRGEVLSDVPPIVKVPEIPRPEVKRATPEEGAAPLPDPVAVPDLSGFERLVDSTYVPPVPHNSAGDTAELPRIEEEYVPRARSYTLGLDPKEQRKRDREQKRLEKKFVKQQQKEEVRAAKEAEKAEKAAQKAAEAEERQARKAAEAEERQARKAAEAEERAARKAAEEEERQAREAAEAEKRAAQKAAEEAAALAAAEATQNELAVAPVFEESVEEAGVEPAATAFAAEDEASDAENAQHVAEEPAALMAAAGTVALAEPGVTVQEAEEASLTLAPRSRTEELQTLAPAGASTTSADDIAGVAAAAPAASGTLSLENAQDTATEDATDAPAPAKSRSTTSTSNASHSTAQPSHGRISRSKKPLVIAICALVVVIAVAVAGGTYYAELWGGRTVPDVVGLGQNEAIAELEQKVFAVEATTVPSDEPAGTVISCEPAGGSRVEEGSTVVLTVATPRIVPEVKGLAQQEAVDALAAEGFTAIEYKEKKSNKDEGVVLSVSPKAGEEAKADTPITLTVAVPFTVPNVEGKSQDEATKLLEDEGYKVSTDWYVTEDIEEGTAVSTDPEAGTKLDSGSDVTLYIAHSRGTELRELTASILPGATLTVDNVTYQVQDVKSTSYRGDGEVNYTVTAKKYEVVTLPFGLGEKTYYDDKVQTIEGGIVWDDNNKVSYANPAITY